MSEVFHIQVVLPIKLGWEPIYRCPFEDVKVGDRVRVPLGKKELTGVVIRTGVSPIDGNRVQEVISRENLSPISPEQLKLWNFIAEYYLCTLGEVFKAACPVSESKAEQTKARKSSIDNLTLRRPSLNDRQVRAVQDILKGFDEGKTVLLKCSEERGKIYAELIYRTIGNGRDVLYLVSDSASIPQIKGARTLFSKTSAASRRETSRLLRSSDEGQLVIGTRQALFLPFRKLGLVIVDEEQSTSYKQEIAAPRYNGRDVCLALAKIQGADSILGSGIPSLESWYNAAVGRYSLVELPQMEKSGITLIDMVAEKRKRGVVGEYFSRIVLEKTRKVLDEGGKVLFLLPWNDTNDAEIAARHILTKVGERIVFQNIRTISNSMLEKFPLTVFLRADYLLGKQDFRADERTMQCLERLSIHCQNLIIQTSRAEHPVFAHFVKNLESSTAGRSDLDTTDILESILEERKLFGAPPFTREVAVYTPDSEGCKIIAGRRYSVTSHFLAKDLTLSDKKSMIAVAAPRNCIIDVDPV